MYMYIHHHNKTCPNTHAHTHAHVHTHTHTCAVRAAQQHARHPTRLHVARLDARMHTTRPVLHESGTQSGLPLPVALHVSLLHTYMTHSYM